MVSLEVAMHHGVTREGSVTVEDDVAAALEEAGRRFKDFRDRHTHNVEKLEIVITPYAPRSL